MLHPTLSYTVIPDDKVRVEGRCYVTGKQHSVEVPYLGFHRWHTYGKSIQEALPDTPKEEREFLMSATSPAGWLQLFGTGEDDTISTYCGSMTLDQFEAHREECKVCSKDAEGRFDL